MEMEWILRNGGGGNQPYIGLPREGGKKRKSLKRWRKRRKRNELEEDREEKEVEDVRLVTTMKG